MHCSNCGAPKQPENKFCPNCGIEFNEKQQTNTRKGIWGKLLGFSAIAAILALGLFFYSFEDLTESIQGQLSALRTHEITEAYYDFTSKGFQEATSFEKFKKFISLNPFFLEIISAQFNEKNIKNQIGILKGVLTTANNENIPVEYNVVKEGDKWKINAIYLLNTNEEEIKTTGPKIAENPNTSSSQAKNEKTENITQEQELAHTVKEFFKALQNKDIHKSYEYVSQDFKSATSEAKFQKFLDAYPFLSNFESLSMQSETIDDGLGTLIVLIKTEKKEIPLEFKIIREAGTWRIWSMRIDLPSSEEPPAELLDKNLLVPPVAEQLNALQNHDISRAYLYFSKDFQAVTSLDDFKKFIERFPILDHYKTMNIKIVGIEKGIGQLLVILKGEEEKENIELLYSLGVENGNWRIWGLQVIQPNEEAEKTIEQSEAKKEEIPKTQAVSGKAKEFHVEDLIIVVRGQLEALEHKNIDKAYKLYTTKEFKKATTLDEFKKFVDKHPIFTARKSSSFTNLMFNNNIATLGGFLASKDNEIYPVEYDLLKEDGEWKILHIEILPSLEEAQQPNDKK